jgi:hypothetical protein
MKYGCGLCGHKQESMNVPCEICGSIRVVSVEVIERVMKIKWEDNDWYTLEEILKDNIL